MSHQSDMDNHADQLNPNNDAYWESRGEDDYPDDWEEQEAKEEIGQRNKSQLNSENLVDFEAAHTYH